MEATSSNPVFDAMLDYLKSSGWEREVFYDMTDKLQDFRDVFRDAAQCITVMNNGTEVLIHYRPNGYLYIYTLSTMHELLSFIDKVEGGGAK